VATATGVWYHWGLPPVPRRWVLIRDPAERFEPPALLRTDLEATAQLIVEWFVLRWHRDVTFPEGRTPLGVATQRQWSDRAIRRTTPARFALFSLVTLVAPHRGQRPCLPRQAVWYDQPLPTFVAARAAVRRELWPIALFAPSSAAPAMVQIPRNLFERLTDTLAFAV
jgi:hypothetical protein